MTYYGESNKAIEGFVRDIEIIDSFFYENFNIPINQPFSVTIMPSVWDFTSKFGVSSRVGAIYFDSQAYFQPLLNLKSKERYKKTLFTEYSHFYIDIITDFNCPPWLNEGLSYYYWLLYSGESQIKTENILDIRELKDFSLMMNDPDKMRDYYSSIMIFFNELFKNGKNINDFVLLLKDNSFDKSVTILKNE